MGAALMREPIFDSSIAWTADWLGAVPPGKKTVKDGGIAGQPQGPLERINLMPVKN